MMRYMHFAADMIWILDPSLSLSLSLSLTVQKQPLLFPVFDVLQLLSKVMAYGDATLKDIKIKVGDTITTLHKC